MTNLETAAAEVFTILQSYGYTVTLYGEDGNRVDDPKEARRMFARPENMLVSLIDDGENSNVSLYIGKSTKINAILGLVQSLRSSATNFNLLFYVRQYGRQISPKMFANGVVKETARTERNIYMKSFLEGEMYGTSRSSYLTLESPHGGKGARMIVRHSDKINDSKLGARSRCIESIFVENPMGERFLFPTTQLAPARAMTQHVNHGGTFADAVGAQILRMANDYAGLATASRHVMTNATRLPEGAISVREACRCQQRKIRKTFEKMYRPAGYQNESARIVAMSNALIEGQADEDTPSVEKIDEMRRLLMVDDTELPESVFEAVCRAVSKEANDSENSDNNRVEEDRLPPKPMVHITFDGNEFDSTAPGKKKQIHFAVDVETWNKLKQRPPRIDLMRPPANSSDDQPLYRDKTAELMHKLSLVVPLIRDDGLMNIMSYIGDNMQDERNPENLRKMKIITKTVLDAAGIGLDAGVPVNNPAIRELAEWIGRFETRRVLRENQWNSDLLDPHQRGENPDDEDDSEFNEALDQVCDDFDPEAFVENYVKENIGDDNTADSGDLLDAIDRHLVGELEEKTDGKFWPSSLKHVAREEFLPKVVAALEDRGVEVMGMPADDIGEHEEGETTDELSEYGDDDEEQHDMHMDEEMKLTPEDVLLPSTDQNDSFRREVTKPVVTDPMDGKKEEPDQSYIERLRTLAGMTSGQTLA